MERRKKAEMIRVIDARIEARSFVGRAVFLFGHCNATEEMADYLLSRKITPVAILDNNTSKQGLTYREIIVRPPELIQDYYAQNSIVLIANRFFPEMSEQCRRLGYGGEIVQVVEYNTFAEYSMSDETLKHKTERMRRGVKALEHIRAEYPAQHLVICPNNALGDVYWAMSFLPAYLDKNGIGETSIIVTGEGCFQVAGMFGAENIIKLIHNEMDELIQAVIFTRESNCIIAHHDMPYTDNIIKWLDKHFLSFIDYYRCAVYGLTKDTQPFLPCKLAPFENREKIQEGKTVILSPYAKSVVELPPGFWEKTAAGYTAEGFNVYTNVVNDEQAVAGTSPLNIPIEQMHRAAEHAGTFIGIRNGLCDVLNAAVCRKIVVFPDCHYSTTPHKAADFFAMPGWETIII